MKNIITLLLMITICFSGCRKEKLEDKYPWLVGTWMARTKITRSVAIAPHQSGLECVDAPYQKHYVEFKNNGSFVVRDENNANEIDKGRVVKLKAGNKFDPLSPSIEGMEYEEYYFNIKLKSKKDFYKNTFEFISGVEYSTKVVVCEQDSVTIQEKTVISLFIGLDNTNNTFYYEKIY